jgi:acyl-CoA thioesterase FadM
MQTSVIELPFNRFVGLQLSDDPGKLLQLPASEQYLNHLGTVHASAQLALAEATSGEFLLRELGAAGDLIPVVRRMECKFRKPANGALTSSVTTPISTLEELKLTLNTKGRALITIDVELHDAAGNHTLSATVEWFITK